jgi:UDP-2-acetamido-2-deoxy-ribo-hexuluronate aminotransferase
VTPAAAGDPVRMAELARRHARVADEVEGAVLSVLRSGRYIGGPVVAEVEGRLAGRMGFEHGVGAASGTAALVQMLRGARVTGRVAVPALSFYATYEAVVLAGCEPVVVDVLPDRPQMDPSLVPDVDAVLTVPLFGARGPDVDHPRVFCDAAQCLGWGWGRPQGLAAALSLYPAKTVGAAGDGGAVLTDDPQLAAAVRRFGNHAMTGPHEHEGVGTNSRLDAVQAAVVGAHLSELDRRVARRREHARAYDSLGLGLPGDPRDAVHQYIVMHPQRDRLRADLAARGIESAVYYPRPLDGQGSASRCDRALAFCARSLAIPVHAELTDQEHNRVLEGLRAWA